MIQCLKPKQGLWCNFYRQDVAKRIFNIAEGDGQLFEMACDSRNESV